MRIKAMPVTGIILFILLGVIAGGVWYWNVHKKRIIRNELAKEIHKKSDGLYTIDYKELELDEINGSLSVSSFRLTYDSIRYRQLQNENKAPFLLFSITIPEIRAAGVKTPRALLEKEITGHSLSIVNPVIEILYTKAGKDSSRKIPDKEVYRQILGNLNLIRLDSVIISNAEIITKDLESGTTFVRFQNTSISLRDVSVDSIADMDTTRILFSKEIELDCATFAWQSSDGFYKYQVDSISFRSAVSGISIKNFFVRPLLNEAEFIRKKSFQTDRMDFAINNIELRNADFFKIADEKILSDTLLIGSASFKLYRDRNKREERVSKVGSYPQQLIEKIPVDIEIKRAIIKDAFIEYKERSPITKKDGRVQFRNSFAEISNITNRKAAIEKNNQMVFDIQCRFLGKVPLSTKWVFYLQHPEGRFDMSGSMGGADARIFNIVTLPMGPARFDEGRLNSLEFDMKGTNYGMKARIGMLYDDLEVDLMKKDDDSIHFKKRGLISFIANIKIKNSNPSGDKSPRVAQVNYKRDVHKSIFNLAWKSIFEGLKEITGAK